MNANSNVCPSAPECQLSCQGSAHTYDILLKSARSLSDKDLHALEDDLAYYAETGLIGINMSRLLVLLPPNLSAFAA